jgi:hypothetical protein
MLVLARILAGTSALPGQNAATGSSTVVPPLIKFHGVVAKSGAQDRTSSGALGQKKQQEQNRPRPYPYTILYTGRLLGYARTPDVQVINQKPGGEPNDTAKEYIRLFDEAEKAHKQDGRVLRLGMGDNFAPDLFARTMQTGLEKECYLHPLDDVNCHFSKVRVPKDRFYYDNVLKPHGWKSVDLTCAKDAKKQKECAKERKEYEEYTKAAGEGVTEIDFDNVAQFIADAKYDAIVPGKHDFYMGPEWLRDVARLLRKRNVYMLAANLIITTVRAPQPANVYPRTPERLQTHTGYDTDWGDISLDLPTMVLPYKRQFLVKNARSVKLNGKLVPPSQFRSLNRNEVDHTPLRLKNPNICVEPGKMIPDHPEYGKTTSGNPEDAVRPPEFCYPLVPAEEACKGTLGPHRKSTCKALGLVDGDDPKKSYPTADVIYLFKDAENKRVGLTPGLNHAFCAELDDEAMLEGKTKRDDKTKPEGKRTCSLFQVQMPFLSYGETNNEGETIGPAPYTVVDHKIAVFGVVDSDLLTNVGLLNTAWLNTDHQRDTVTNVVAPDYALKQALEQCDADCECREAPKVLMAQMSYAKAAQLIAQMDTTFDVVISQADAKHNTGKRTLTEELSAAQKSLPLPPDPAPGPMFVLTPPEPFRLDEPASTFTPLVSQATIEWDGTTWKLSNEVRAPDLKNPPNPPGGNNVQAAEQREAQKPQDGKAVPILNLCSEKPQKPPDGKAVLCQASKAALPHAKAQNTPTPPLALAPDPSEDLSILALLAMQDALHTDIAFLQKRDLFSANSLSLQTISRDELQNQINQIFWKGDFVITLHVTGATLKKLMKQSKKFDNLDHDLLSTEIEKGRSLLSVGIWNDPNDSDSYYVNGMKLDDTKLYSVAATEFLALGDTGYSDLTPPDVPPATRVEDFEHLKPLSQLICQQIARTNGYGDVPCEKEVLTAEYFDSSSQVPFDTTPGFDTATHYATVLKQFSQIGVPHTGAGGKVQQRSFFSLNLESMDFSYGGVYINHVGQAPGKFAGISAPGVTTSGSNNLGEDSKLRGTFDYRRGTLYLLSDTTFTKAVTTTAVVPTISANLWGIEGGGTLRLHWPHPRPYWLSLQYSGRYEGELTAPGPTAIALGTTGTPSIPRGNLLLNPPQSNTIYGRGGLRAEFGDIYFEAGLEDIESRNILKDYVFTTSNVGDVRCTPDNSAQYMCAGGSTPGKIATDTDLSPGTPVHSDPTDYRTGGAYLNFNIKFPLWSRKDASGADQSWYFILTNKGDLYFNSHNDTTVQTRYLDKVTFSFSIPIYGKLMLTPKVDFLLYEDKVAHQHFASATPALSLSYSFNYRSGMDFWRSLGYGAITQAQPASSK